MPRFRIPNQHKSVVSVKRPDAFERNVFTPVAAAQNIVCMLSPETDGRARQDAVDVTAGVGIGELNWMALLEAPLLRSDGTPVIEKGDMLIRSDGQEFRIERVLWMEGSPVMQLQLKSQGVL